MDGKSDYYVYQRSTRGEARANCARARACFLTTRSVDDICDDERDEDAVSVWVHVGRDVRAAKLVSAATRVKQLQPLNATSAVCARARRENSDFKFMPTSGSRAISTANRT